MRNKKSYLFLNKTELNKQSKTMQYNIKKDIKNFFKRQPGIKNAWTQEQLLASKPQKYSEKYLAKKQLYPGRTGDIILQPQPHHLFSNKVTGTSHMTPYKYDTHVPLILYQQGRQAHKVIQKKVWLTQLAPTICNILKIKCPCDADENPLPT